MSTEKVLFFAVVCACAQAYVCFYVHLILLFTNPLYLPDPFTFASVGSTLILFSSFVPLLFLARP